MAATCASRIIIGLDVPARRCAACDTTVLMTSPALSASRRAWGQAGEGMDAAAAHWANSRTGSEEGAPARRCGWLVAVRIVVYGDAALGLHGGGRQGVV